MKKDRLIQTGAVIIIALIFAVLWGHKLHSPLVGWSVYVFIVNVSAIRDGVDRLARSE